MKPLFLSYIYIGGNVSYPHQLFAVTLYTEEKSYRDSTNNEIKIVENTFNFLMEHKNHVIILKNSTDFCKMLKIKYKEHFKKDISDELNGLRFYNLPEFDFNQLMLNQGIYVDIDKNKIIDLLFKGEYNSIKQICVAESVMNEEIYLKILKVRGRQVRLSSKINNSIKSEIKNNNVEKFRENNISFVKLEKLD